MRAEHHPTARTLYAAVLVTSLLLSAIGSGTRVAAAAQLPPEGTPQDSEWAGALLDEITTMRCSPREALELVRRGRDALPAGAPLDARALLTSAVADRLFDLGRFSEAQGEYAAAEELAHRAGLRDLRAHAAIQIVTILLWRGAAAEAKDRLPGLRELVDERATTELRARVALVTASSLGTQGRLEEALAESERGIALARNLATRVMEARLERMGSFFLQGLRRQPEAHLALANAQRLFEAEGVEAEAASCRLVRAQWCLTATAWDLALAELDAAEVVFARRGHEARLAEITALRGEIAAHLGSRAEAQRLLEDAQARGQTLGLTRVVEYCRRTLSRAEFVPAEARVRDLTGVLEDARRRGHREDTIGAAMSLAEATRVLGRRSEAETLLLECERLALQGADRLTLARVLRDRAGLRFDAGEYEAGLGLYRDAALSLRDGLGDGALALGLSREIRQRERATLEGIASCLRALDPPADAELAMAFEVVQVFHGLAIAQELADFASVDANAMPSHLERRLAEARERLEQQPDVASSVAAQAAEIELRAHRNRGKLGAVVLASLRDLQETLPEDAALLEFCLTSTAPFGLLITRKGLHYLPLGDARTLTDEVLKVREMLDPTQGRAPFRSELARALRALGKRTLGGVRSTVTPPALPRRLFIAPDGVLGVVPFEIFLTADADPTREEREWPLLGREHVVSYVPSATVWLQQRKRARDVDPSRLRYAGFGNPTPPRRVAQDSPRLPGSVEEIVSLARLVADDEIERTRLSKLRNDGGASGKELGGRGFRVLLGTAASEASLRDRPELRNARVLHMACHACMDAGIGELSRLVLAGSPGADEAMATDGLVFAHDLLDLRLAPDLLVLSACETQGGRWTTHDGVASLTRAALAGGARSVLGTQWRIGDEAARELVVASVGDWLKGDPSLAHSLQHAKLAALARGLPMRVWAAFTLWDADD